MSPALKGLLVGISISPPERSELEAKGVVGAHLDRMFLDLAAHLLALGASLAYGGDLRIGGFTRRLVALLETYSDERPGPERVRLFLLRPTWEDADASTRADVSLVATPELVEPAANVPDSLTRLRQRMDDACDARIVLGGRLVGYTGRYPGIAEEAWLAARRGTPLYLLGGFGGCAGRLADALLGADPVELTREFQTEHNPGYEAVVNAAGDIDYDALRRTFRELGPGGLRNGLAAAESAKLARSSDLNFVAGTVLAGLRRVSERS
jgi:SLOG cluster2